MIAFLGGTIGNLLPAQRAAFLRQLRATLQPGETVLLGTDLVKSPDVLVPAYDDAAGVTAEFNKNVLHVVNRELKADFDPDAFAHVAVWDARAEWIEMRLRSLRDQRVHVELLNLDVSFARGEELRTEVSAKFRQDTVAHEIARAGLRLSQWWTDADRDFALSLSFA
jgi:L-histidine N-alpha-methyltransferase